MKPYLYYFEDCKAEFDVVCHVLNWLGFQFTPYKSFAETIEHGKNPILVDVDQNRVLGVGFNGIIKHLDGKGLCDARKSRI